MLSADRATCEYYLFSLTFWWLFQCIKYSLGGHLYKGSIDWSTFLFALRLFSSSPLVDSQACFKVHLRQYAPSRYLLIVGHFHYIIFGGWDLASLQRSTTGSRDLRRMVDGKRATWHGEFYLLDLISSISHAHSRLEGMPRRYYDTSPVPYLNLISTIGSWILMPADLDVCNLFVASEGGKAGSNPWMQPRSNGRFLHAPKENFDKIPCWEGPYDLDNPSNPFSKVGTTRSRGGEGIWDLYGNHRDDTGQNRDWLSPFRNSPFGGLFISIYLSI